jgi:hypothetical protein
MMTPGGTLSMITLTCEAPRNENLPQRSLPREVFERTEPKC